MMINKLKYLVLAFSITVAYAEEKGEGWVNLLEGDSLKLWKNGSKENRTEFTEVGEQWSVKDGVLILDQTKKGRGGDIITKKDDYFNFELKFEFLVGAEGNSGVKYRVNEKTIGLEYQILDSKSPVTKRTISAIYDLKAAKADLKVNAPSVEWNKGRIVAKGNQLEHWLNGEKVAAIEFASEEWKAAFALSKYRKETAFAEVVGPILFQDHGDDVRFRNVFIKELVDVKK